MFYVFFDVSLNKLLTKQASCRWFETPWRSCDVTAMDTFTRTYWYCPKLGHDDVIKRKIFRVTGPLWGETTGHRWLFPQKGQWRGALIFSLICAWTNGWANNRDAGNLRLHCAHYDVTVMVQGSHSHSECTHAHLWPSSTPYCCHL